MSEKLAEILGAMVGVGKVIGVELR